mmetsp:Transcript_18697/g.29662  ORF Transcript_18697/g.29662 Transcript_18697/m.29662 type:complete len:202 (-) Transcript_18697:168-773(-)
MSSFSEYALMKANKSIRVKPPNSPAVLYTKGSPTTPAPMMLFNMLKITCLMGLSPGCFKCASLWCGVPWMHGRSAWCSMWCETSPRSENGNGTEMEEVDALSNDESDLLDLLTCCCFRYLSFSILVITPWADSECVESSASLLSTVMVGTFGMHRAGGAMWTSLERESSESVGSQWWWGLDGVCVMSRREVMVARGEWSTV